MSFSIRHFLVLTAGIVALTGCASRDAASNNEDQGFLSRLNPFDGESETETVRQSAPEAGIGVNGHLWRATLETLSFMPLSEVDPFGGVIITDWFANPELPNERFKSTIFILDSRLRADALSVQLFKQTRDANGNWNDAAVDPATRLQIENAILTRARQLRIATLDE